MEEDQLCPTPWGGCSVAFVIRGRVGGGGGEDCHRPVLSGLIQLHFARFWLFPDNFT